MLSLEDLWILLLVLQASSDELQSENKDLTATTSASVFSKQSCSFWDHKGCLPGECCVKEVISFEDLDRDILASTICKPMLTLGQLCLRQSEGYLCDCSKGLQCKYKNNETYGHCVPG